MTFYFYIYNINIDQFFCSLEQIKLELIYFSKANLNYFCYNEQKIDFTKVNQF